MSTWDPARAAEYFDEFGEREWTRFEQGVTPPAGLDIHIRFLERFVRAGDRVLDAGAGPGRFSVELVRLGADVVALDISPGQLEQLRARLPEIEAHLSDVTDLSRFADDSFDVTVCYGGPLSYVLGRAEDTLAELVRVTRPGGHVLVSLMSTIGTVVHYLAVLFDLARRDGVEHQMEIVGTGFLPEGPDYGHLAQDVPLERARGDALAPRRGRRGRRLGASARPSAGGARAAGTRPAGRSRALRGARRDLVGPAHRRGAPPAVSKKLVIYLVAEPETPELARAAVDGGADIIEIGFPFSDPLAEGPTIRRASERALARGMRTKQCLDVLARTRELLPETPLVPMTYAAILEAYGYERFAADARERGASSFILVDLPVEVQPALRRIQLVAPTSTEERIRAAAAATEGWLYLVTVTGTTGARAELSPALAPLVDRVRGITDTPLYAGFGISTPEQARAAADLADGAVVGSRAVQVAEQGADALRAYVASLRAAIDT